MTELLHEQLKRCAEDGTEFVFLGGCDEKFSKRTLAHLYNIIVRDYIPIPMNSDGTPKHIFDSDGIEIKYGDTVYTYTSDICMKVLWIDYMDESEACVFTEAGRFYPDCLTHQQPAFDVDGSLIHPNDIVYTLSGEKHMVSKMDYSGNIVKVWYADGGYDFPFNLTHEPLDSLSSLKEAYNEVYKPASRSPYKGLLDRAIKLIERYERQNQRDYQMENNCEVTVDE